jgi:hypothetical protein
MKNHIVKHYPNFVDRGDDPVEEADFETDEELLSIPWVKSFSEHNKFFKFGMSDELLVATYKEGKEWWVVGSIEHPELVKLPRILNCSGNKANFEA